VEEITFVIKKLKNNKAHGKDGLPAELFKCGSHTLSRWLHRIFAQVLESEELPQDWSDAVILPFFKKGDTKTCQSYRGISLIDNGANIFASLLLRRFLQQRDLHTQPNQGGFRPGRGCVDKIFTLCRVLEHRHAFQQPSVTCFVDFAAAFDSIDHEGLWRIRQTDIVPTKIINLIKAYYKSTRSKVRCYGADSNYFDIQSGVRQGRVLSPTLFNYTIDWTLANALGGFAGVEISATLRLTGLDYADDIALIADNHAELQLVLDRMKSCAAQVGMKISAAKTKVKSSGINPTNIAPIVLNGMQLEEVDQFRYVGTTFTPNGQSKDEILGRIAQARAAFGCLQRCLWSRSEIRRSTKCRIYQALVRSILLYGYETWAVRNHDLHAAEVIDRQCLRRILRIRLLDRVSNDDLLHRAHLPSVNGALLARRLKWFGHALRRPP